MVYTIEYTCISERGNIRAVNQDNFYCRNAMLSRAAERTDGDLGGLCETMPGVLFGIFDGMGGEQSGEDASYIAAATASEVDMNHGMDSLRSFCEEANRRIVAFTQENGLNTCGSTAAMMYFHNDHALVCNLGDSRIYQVFPDRVAQLSKDHVIHMPGYKKASLVQFLGIPEDEMALEPQLDQLPLNRDDCFLICSDGLTDMVAETEIARIIARHASLKEASQALIEAALAAGGRDNTTLILVRVVSVRKQWRDYWPFSMLLPSKTGHDLD